VLRRLGYVAMSLSIDASTSRTCRLRNATPDRLAELIGANLADLLRVVEFNVERGVSLYRISSHLIPFASHPVNELPWWDDFAGPLAQVADVIARSGMRVSVHPGQFTVLSSPNPKTVADSLRELEWHARLLDTLRADTSCKMILHVGGAYGGKTEAMSRFVEVANRLPEAVRRRLVIENDDVTYTTAEVLDISARTGLPIVFDWLHHKINPGADTGAETARLIAACFDSWRPEDGPPKVHLSSQAEGARAGSHADWIDPEDLLAFLRQTPDREFDCMLEAKKKDLALFRLREEWERNRIMT